MKAFKEYLMNGTVKKEITSFDDMRLEEGQESTNCKTMFKSLKNYEEFFDKRLKDLKQDKYSNLDFAKGQKAAFEDAKEILDDILKHCEQILKESSSISESLSNNEPKYFSTMGEFPMDTVVRFLEGNFKDPSEPFKQVISDKVLDITFLKKAVKVLSSAGNDKLASKLEKIIRSL